MLLYLLSDLDAMSPLNRDTDGPFRHICALRLGGWTSDFAFNAYRLRFPDGRLPGESLYNALNSSEALLNAACA